MDKQGNREATPQEITEPLSYRRGPFSAKTCHVDRADRIKVRVELGFRVSAVADVRMANFDTRVLSQDEVSRVKSCLVVLIGGHSLVLDQVSDPWDGVHKALMFVPCSEPYAGVNHVGVGTRYYMDLGNYLDVFGRSVEFDPDLVKQDYLSRR